MKPKLLDIIAVVSEGYADQVMEVAKTKGARGGTILQANGSVSDSARKLYGIGISPEKEIVMILVQPSLANDILQELYLKLGSNSEAKGIFFALPVTHASENLTAQYEKKKEDEE